MKKQKIKRGKKKKAPKKANDKEKYFHCNVKGHQRRNYPAYLATVKNKKKNMPSKGTSELFIIKTNLMIFSSSSEILDFGLIAHLLTSVQDLEEVRGLKKSEITL